MTKLTLTTSPAGTPSTTSTSSASPTPSANHPQPENTPNRATIQARLGKWTRRAGQALWHGLQHPGFGAVLLVLAVALVLAAWQLPQLPGQLNAEPASANRWMNEAGAAYGFWGNLWLALGLFNVQRSPLLYLLLTLTALAAAAQLADRLGALAQYRTLLDNLSAPVNSPNASGFDPIPIPAHQPVHRLRISLNLAHDEAAGRLYQSLRAEYAEVRVAAIAKEAQGPAPREEIPATEETAADETITEQTATETDDRNEQRYLGLRRQRMVSLQPLLAAGLLLALGGLWWSLALGWQVNAPPLAPGTTYRSVNHSLVVSYTAPISQEVAAPMPRITLELDESRTNLDVSSPIQTQFAGTLIAAEPAMPGLFIAVSDGAPLLLEPGSVRPRAQAGLVFPRLGGEETLLIPTLGAGLRIVPRSDEPGTFLLELYRSSEVQPVYRAELTPRGQVTIPLGEGERQTLTVVNLPGLALDIQRRPGRWLTWLGLAIAGIGALTHLRKPRFLAAQLIEWPVGRSALILQSDDRDGLARMAAELTASPAGR